ncbi:DUF2339 domain-containing protein [Peteryoungia ipomoeae]|uniref:DUF2339 domain-containing protein n=1 Tax=Peteryoungia ipomoeae TaxID=1210932 RepID=A0A4S8PC41_9HYPH|nr:DUF2339 domain-containing protein [Peteryoungia ipomoeae]THV25729.1 DUF2339 domain-containing protein [Peteryoungia ipomoeae]
MSLTLLIVQFIILMTVLRGTGKRITQLEQEVGALRERLVELDQGQKRPAPAMAGAPEDVAAEEGGAPDAPPSVASAETVLQETAEPHEPDEIITTSTDDAGHEIMTVPATKAAPNAPSEPARQPESLENLLGARWAVWAGGLALALGGLFLIRYSIESGLLGPGVRLSLAGLFGLFLIGAGELLRRKALPQMAALHENAMIPGILTAAGSVSMFGAIYAAHGIYGFFGPTLAFMLLALTAFSVLGLSLLHGQALAGLGLAGSMLTPVLIASTSPKPWALFGFLAVSQVATSAAARLRNWHVVPGLAQLGLGLWAVLYVAASDYAELTPVSLALIAMIATWMLLWPGRRADRPAIATVNLDGLCRQLGSGPLWLDLSMALGVLLPALAIINLVLKADLFAPYVFAALIATLSAAGSFGRGAIWPSCIAALGALLGAVLDAGVLLQLIDMALDGGGVAIELNGLTNPLIGTQLVMGSVFLALAIAFLNRNRGDRAPLLCAVWATIAATVPLILAAISFAFYGTYGFDLTHGLFALALSAALLGTAEFTQGDATDSSAEVARDILVIGSFAALVLSLHALTDGLVTTLALAVSGFAYLLATRLRTWRSLPWMMVLALAGVLARIAWEPTLVGAEALSRTPVFNQLLIGYGLPALLAIAGAWQMRDWPSVRLRNALQALAALFGLLAVAILVRHAMNGGVLDSSTPTLGEQSIYTLLVIGLSGILMTLDLRAPSLAFRYGSMIAGGLSILQVLSLHLGALNPYFSGESTGNWPLINLLLIGYLIPGLGYAGLAYYARSRRPAPYVTLLALSGAILGFAWVTLSVRRFWHGSYIAEWKGFGQAETYSYSVAWLAIGVMLLILGSRFGARSLRIASAVVVMISVGKAFLIDMSNLEGVLRALSFIGLGFVLIGIGLFYQKILTSTVQPRKPEPIDEPPQAAN